MSLSGTGTVGVENFFLLAARKLCEGIGEGTGEGKLFIEYVMR